jgi:hypothetical protein
MMAATDALTTDIDFFSSASSTTNCSTAYSSTHPEARLRLDERPQKHTKPPSKDGRAKETPQQGWSPKNDPAEPRTEAEQKTASSVAQDTVAMASETTKGATSERTKPPGKP